MRKDQAFLPAAAITFCLWFAAGFGNANPARAQDTVDPPGRGPVQLLFIHHSCGGQLMAALGDEVGGESGSSAPCVYVSHPNGGGLRDMLETQGFQVNEASYGSIVGEDTDIRHWHGKFRDQMDRVLRTKRQDELLPEGVTNDIVAFKSCFPNNDFAGPGTEPGDAEGAELTVANAKAAYRSLLPFFRQHPDVLFVAFTAPPLVEPQPVGMKQKIKAFFSGKPKQGELAREFNGWMVDRDHGWLAEYELSNVVVFDYFGTLADPRTGWTQYPARPGKDSHPNAEGNQKAAEAFVPFVQEAWARLTGVGL